MSMRVRLMVCSWPWEDEASSRPWQARSHRDNRDQAVQQSPDARQPPGPDPGPGLQPVAAIRARW